MPLFKYYCPHHPEFEFSALIHPGEDEPDVECDVCNTKLIKMLGNIGVMKLMEMANRGTAKQREVGMMDKMEKRKQDHFVNKDVYDVIDADRGTMDRAAAIQHKVFQKEGGRWRVRKKEDLK